MHVHVKQESIVRINFDVLCLILQLLHQGHQTSLWDIPGSNCSCALIQYHYVHHYYPSVNQTRQKEVGSLEK